MLGFHIITIPEDICLYNSHVSSHLVSGSDYSISVYNCSNCCTTRILVTLELLYLMNVGIDAQKSTNCVLILSIQFCSDLCGQRNTAFMATMFHTFLDKQDPCNNTYIVISLFVLWDFTLPIFQVLMCCNSTSSCSSLHAFSFSISILQSAGCWFRRITKWLDKQSAWTTCASLLLAHYNTLQLHCDTPKMICQWLLDQHQPVL